MTHLFSNIALTTETLFALVASLLVALALTSVFTARHLIRRLLALNILSSAVFLLLVLIARTADGTDPVPHALVLTGIVVSVSTTAVVLALYLRRYRMKPPC
ncbi:NADH-quinone oxidoreductase subunit K [Halomonas sp. M1]|uniref:NADH-quinone oxidoreductase subunit K n=1 Tax=unclassified Halomonas TaxID=2609666 RepID=UPI00023A59A0|nr:MULTISPECIES: NADH-quinone oxidoreductase subunit K [unclassified Halomonas]AVI61933.1 hypothetical protein BB497_04060 [Halomonas sp. GFAJ-1]EHK61108.1 multisubunit sodium/proton antiporter subunit MrpC [Halomonas sp. GFAJ-1]MDP3535867.1 NADH-quinone oxidoreductase subunit K [Halomonas sp.]WFE70345.1 NADH-quinone oxidoreductase subunit K [Halomonas sp. M1]